MLGSFASNPPVQDVDAWVDAGCNVDNEGPFGIGHQTDSKTKLVTYFVGAYLGTGQCVTLIDTPGFSDSDGSDGAHMKNLTQILNSDLDGEVIMLD